VERIDVGAAIVWRRLSILAAIGLGLLLWAPAAHAWTLRANNKCGTAGSAAGTGFSADCSINSTTGGDVNLLIVTLGEYGAGALTLTDSVGITWSCRAVFGTGTTTGGGQLCYAWNGSTGWGTSVTHTISVSHVNNGEGYPGATFSAWASGSTISSDPFDVETTAVNASAATSATVGSITPTATDLIVTTGGPDDGNFFDAATVTSFTLADRQTYSAGHAESSQLWYTTSAAGISATWNWSSRAYHLYIAGFKPGSGAAAPPVCQRLLLGVGGC
jgi:hypothetical protein